jgi:hypothetical protein
MNRHVLSIGPVLLLAAVCLCLNACGVPAQTGDRSPNVAHKNIDLVAATQEATKDVGTIQKTVSTGDKGQVFIFSEYHTSRIGQLQIATMLLRLHDKYGLKKIGLEGKVTSAKPINAAWFQGAGGEQAKAEREALGVRMVADGEISSAEFIAMEFPDAEVFGVESAEEYGQTLDVKSNPEVEYLVAIAEKGLTPEDGRRVMQLMNQKKNDQALELMLTADPWVKERYGNLKNGRTTSSEEMVARIHELQGKARSVGADVSPSARQDIEKIASFYGTASKRSETMVDHTIEIIARTDGPVAMVIGAAHADKVSELLGKRGVSYALIQPIDLDPTYGSLTVEQFNRKSNGGWARDSKGTLGHVLNSQRKPPPVIERSSGESYASMQLAGMLIAKAARGHKKVPDDIWPQLSTLPGLRVDQASFELDGYDVIYRAWLTTDKGEKEVWARVGTAPSAAPTTLEAKLLEAERLLKPLAGGGGRRGGGGVIGQGGAISDGHDEPGRGPGRAGRQGEGNEHDDSGQPRNSKRAENEGPGDAKRNDFVISRTSRETLAAYGSSREDVRRVQQISY